MITSAAFAGKRYAVLGLARSGAAAARALLESGARVTVWDRQPGPREAFEGRCEIADPLEMDLSGFDGVVVSPGVPLNTHPIKPHAARFGVPVIGDVELFALARPGLPPHRVVGITGTNGKSTSAALIHHILSDAGVPTTLGGNIGEPILAEQPLARGGVYVLELSSFQIDLTRSLACEIAALTNITPDHLDRYASFEDYAFAKGRLFAMQGAGQAAIFGTTDGAVAAIIEAVQARREDAHITVANPQDLTALQSDWPGLKGSHNLQNAALAVAIVERLGITRAQWEEALAGFRGLPHRMEIACEVRGVTYINDSKATNPASAAPALSAFPREPAIRNSAPRVHWIVGGLAKEDGLGECASQLGGVAAAYTIGQSGPRFAELLESEGVQVERCEMLSEAVRRAGRAAQAGDAVLLSPACASYDQFADYTKRGDQFRQLVDAITGSDADGAHDTEHRRTDYSASHGGSASSGKAV